MHHDTSHDADMNRPSKSAESMISDFVLGVIRQARDSGRFGTR